jgi:signal transduction histidine kinase
VGARLSEGVHVSTTSAHTSGAHRRLARRAVASARVRLIVVGLLIAALVAVLSLSLLGSISGFSTASERARHSDVVIAQTSTLEHQMLAVQTGLRGYAPTGDPRFLQTYRTARRTLPGLMSGLLRLVSDNPHQTARARGIRDALDGYLATYPPQALALGRTQVTRAQLTSLYLIGQRAMDDLRRRIDAFVSAERQLSAARDRRAASSDDAARQHAILALVGTLALLALLVIYVLHDVLTPIGRTAAAARALREGDLGVRLPEEHSTELGDLTTAFNRMADRVQRDQERREALLAQERETNERLLQVDRLKDELVMVVSHELRTPLTSIQGYVDLVLDDEELDPGVRRFLQTAQRNAGRLHRLVEDLLTLSSIDRAQLSLDLAPVDLAALTAGEVATSRNLGEAKGVAVDLVVRPAGSTMVRADAVRLGQVVDNLVANAVKFTPAGGRVRVEVSAAADTVCLVVADTGIGIPADEHEHLFERFFRASTATDRHIPGTGLGLAISKAIVEAHGGTIEVASAAGRGSTFRVTLPVSAAAPAAA